LQLLCPFSERCRVGFGKCDYACGFPKGFFTFFDPEDFRIAAQVRFAGGLLMPKSQASPCPVIAPHNKKPLPKGIPSAAVVDAKR
jgi:hypothetical protein